MSHSKDKVENEVEGKNQYNQNVRTHQKICTVYYDTTQ